MGGDSHVRDILVQLHCRPHPPKNTYFSGGCGLGASHMIIVTELR